MRRERRKAKTIVVRRARSEEKLKTLDGKEHALTNDMLDIADDDGPIALAGIMGGAGSEINDRTITVIFEAANFDARNIRRTAAALGIRTESSARFEKSLDPRAVELALRKAVNMTLELIPGSFVASSASDVANFTVPAQAMTLPIAHLERVLGLDIPPEESAQLLPPRLA